MESVETRSRILFILYVNYVATHILGLGDDSMCQDVSEIIGYCSIFQLLLADADPPSPPQSEVSL